MRQVPNLAPSEWANFAESVDSNRGLGVAGAGQISPPRQCDTELGCLTVGAGKELRIGEVLAGKYEIERVLGTGAMGVVVAARHVVLGERVAIKFLLPEVVNEPVAIARFMREAQAAARIKSEHIARVTDVGSCEDRTPFMVMEYLEGVDLSALLKSKGPLPVVQTVEFVLQACEAIAEAHVLGIVHRDLKPSNLFCIRQTDGNLAIKVLDFGISKLTGSLHSNASVRITDTSALMGSPMYMSPEQLQSSCDVDLRTDIWSLGIILFELLTGESPFLGASLPRLVLNIANQPPQSVRQLQRDVPAGLGDVIEKCLRKDRTERYSSVAELALALAPFGSKRAELSIERVLGIIESARGSALLNASQGGSVAHSLLEGPPRLRVAPAHRVTLSLIFWGVFSALGLALLAWTASRGATHAQWFTLGKSAGATMAVHRVRHKASPRVSAATAIATKDGVGREAESLAVVAIAPDGLRAAKNKQDKSLRGSSDADSRTARVATTSSAVPTRSSKSLGSPNTLPQAECMPPYNVDTLGRKHFKRECYLNQTP